MISYTCLAIKSLCPGAEWTMDDDNYETLNWVKGNGHDKPTKSAIASEVSKLESEEPMKVLRLQRNQKLTESDWVVIKANESGSTVPSAWKTYRQNLRNLPETASPKLDGDNLINVTWPTQPT
tara:strand:- start:10100 stop:10468 length:369 start_codon:yes stop_codon:yes gene_type:complete